MNNTNNPPYIFFWGHQPKKDGSISKSCLSQWYPSPISRDYTPQGTQEEYPTAEHFMMAEKARLFNDQKTRQQILQAVSPQEAKMLGRTIKNFDEKMWKQHRYDIVLKVTREKFLQNHSLRAFLYSTRGSTLVEASPFDTVWGIGLSVDDTESRDPKKWRGQFIRQSTHARS